MPSGPSPKSGCQTVAWLDCAPGDTSPLSAERSRPRATHPLHKPQDRSPGKRPASPSFPLPISHASRSPARCLGSWPHTPHAAKAEKGLAGPRDYPLSSSGGHRGRKTGTRKRETPNVRGALTASIHPSQSAHKRESWGRGKRESTAFSPNSVPKHALRAPPRHYSHPEAGRMVIPTQKGKSLSPVRVPHTSAFRQLTLIQILQDWGSGTPVSRSHRPPE